MDGWPSLLPDLEYKPSLRYCVTLFAAGGLFVGFSNNFLQGLPPFFRPYRHIGYTLVGALLGVGMYRVDNYCRIRNAELIKYKNQQKKKLSDEISRREKLTKDSK